MNLRILSLDYDGCISNSRFTSSFDKCIVKSNQALIEYILKSSSNFERTITFVGSNRQSFNIDFMNKYSHHNGSCFPQTKKFTEYLRQKNVKNIEFDKFLLADIYGNVDFGESLKLIEEIYSEDAKYADWVFDSEKITLIYAQVHKVSNENLNENIVYEFFDDREDILNSLHTFFSKYPELLPKNVSLILNHYHGERVFKYKSEIKGTGESDKDFRNTVKIMAIIATENFTEEKRYSMKIEGTSSFFMNSIKIRPSIDVTPSRIKDFRIENNIISENEIDNKNTSLNYMYSFGYAFIGMGVASSLLNISPILSCIFLSTGGTFLLFCLMKNFFESSSDLSEPNKISFN